MDKEILKVIADESIKSSINSFYVGKNNLVFVRTMLLIPDGSFISVNVQSTDDNKFVVSDFGFASKEADLNNVYDKYFNGIAFLAAKNNCINFTPDGEFYSDKLNKNQLFSGICVVANAVKYTLDRVL